MSLEILVCNLVVMALSEYGIRQYWPHRMSREIVFPKRFCKGLLFLLFLLQKYFLVFSHFIYLFFFFNKCLEEFTGEAIWQGLIFMSKYFTSNSVSLIVGGLFRS